MSAPSDHPAAAYPGWLARPVRCPLAIVCGPAGNGARAYAEGRIEPGETLIELGDILLELAGDRGAGGDWIPRGLAERNRRLETLDRSDFTAAWLIVPAPRAWQRAFWQARGEVTLLDPGLEAALAGARAEGIGERHVHSWYSEHRQDLLKPAQIMRDFIPAARPSAAKRGYGAGSGGQNWSKLRDAQLLREPTCRFCRTEGRGPVVATVVDHELPFVRPDGTKDWRLWGKAENHRSLCKPCHDSRGAKGGANPRPEKPPGAGVDGRPLDPSHPWNRA